MIAAGALSTSPASRRQWIDDVGLSFPAADMIADFESAWPPTGGPRGGRPFHGPPTRHAGQRRHVLLRQRAMQLQGYAPPQVPLAQGPLMPDAANPDDELYDARAYRGIVIALRA